jgi:cyanate permease
MQWFGPEELPLVNGLNNVAVNTGIAVTLFATVPLAERLGWRQALLAYAGLNAASALAWAVLGRDRAAPVAGPPARSARYAEVWRMRETWLITIAFLAPLALYLALNTWLPQYYVEARGMQRAAASRYTGLFNLVGIPSALLGAVLTRRLGLRRPFLIGAGTLVGFGALGMIVGRSPAVLLASAVILGVAFFLAGSPLFTTAMELPGMTPERVALMMGTVFSASYLVSSFSPVWVGWLRDRTGSFVPGLVSWAVLSFALALAGLLLPETGPARNGAFASKMAKQRA